VGEIVNNNQTLLSLCRAIANAWEHTWLSSSLAICTFSAGVGLSFVAGTGLTKDLALCLPTTLPRITPTTPNVT